MLGTNTPCLVIRGIICEEKKSFVTRPEAVLIIYEPDWFVSNLMTSNLELFEALFQKFNFKQVLKRIISSVSKIFS
jgi:hypothetical protein